MFLYDTIARYSDKIAPLIKLAQVSEKKPNGHQSKNYIFPSFHSGLEAEETMKDSLFKDCKRSTIMMWWPAIWKENAKH